MYNSLTWQQIKFAFMSTLHGNNWQNSVDNMANKMSLLNWLKKTDLLFGWIYKFRSDANFSGHVVIIAILLWEIWGQYIHRRACLQEYAEFIDHAILSKRDVLLKSVEK
jgi:hypothetical protein